MDTNQNTHINSFTKGMNSDTSYDMVGADQYLFGLNIRITNNTLIAQAVNANTTEGIVTPVPDGKDIVTCVEEERDGKILRFSDVIEGYDKILATASIDKVGAIIVSNDEGWDVYKVEFIEDKQLIKPTLVFRSRISPDIKKPNGDTEKVDRFSVVLNQETENLLKLYIADGLHPVIQVNLDGSDKDIDIDHLISGRLLPTEKVKIRKVSGRLKTQQLQYVYRLYKKHGTTSKLSLPSVKLQVIDGNRNNEKGNAEDTETSLGFQLTLKPFTDYFDRLQVFRISYIKPNQQPDVYLIHDDKFERTYKEKDGEIEETTKIVVIDKGYDELAQYSIDEFAALNSQIVIPGTLELNQGYLFSGNIKDETLLQFDEIPSKPEARSIYIPVNISGDSTSLKETKVMIYAPSQLGKGGDFQSERSVHDYYMLCGIDINDTEPISYNDLFGSSLLRSLRRTEEYDYGIVYYDKYGARSNVFPIISYDTTYRLNPYEDNGHSTNKLDKDCYKYDSETKVLTANTIGCHFKVYRPAEHDVVAYLIVRRAKTPEYTKNLLLVALSRPSRQGLHSDKTYRTPYYPNVHLSTQFAYIRYGIGTMNINATDLWGREKSMPYFDYAGTNVENFLLYQIFAPEINIERVDTINKIKSSSAELHPIHFAYYNKSEEDIGRLFARSYFSSYWKSLLEFKNTDPSSALDTKEAIDNLTVHPISRGVVLNEKTYQLYEKSKKSGQNVLIPLFDRVVEYTDFKNSETTLAFNMDDFVNINDIKDVKNPNWENGFSDVLINGTGTQATSAILGYKSYQTTVGSDTYVNWVCNGMYNLAATENESGSQDGNNGGVYIFMPVNNDPDDYKRTLEENTKMHWSYGWIGPGPVCAIINTSSPGKESVLRDLIIYYNSEPKDKDTIRTFGTIVANITHERIPYNDSYTPYYGFGNVGFFGGEHTSDICVFDGDIYITPAEFVNMFKTYNFKEFENTIISGQVVYNIPLESKINTFFDYGMNYRNTSSTNLMLEPGQIEGIASQERPLHQYNMIYSDNDSSIDVFTPHTDEDKDTQIVFPQRICYSQLKTNGENIDNWLIFKPADYIDADTRYGAITNLLTSNDTLYYWQQKAFGKLSVNERSLVKDENSNTIQLGQGGVLQRTDYLSTQYGMREQDYAAIAAENNVYWIDRDNKAIVAYNQGVANFGEIMNVQNVVNEYFDDVRRPTIEYDLLNYELVCNFLTRKDPESHDKNLELVFNLKLNCATSVYTRDYDNHIYFNNKLFGLKLGDELTAKQYNYLESDYEPTYSPVMLSFSVNSNASLTKVFDNQKIALVNGPGQLDETSEDMLITKAGMNVFAALKGYKMSDYVYHSRVPFLATKQFSFTTDMDSTEQDPEMYTDRENNICYALPRLGSADYGDRLRGKWLKVDLVDEEPTELLAISHIITKFRQSYS